MDTKVTIIEPQKAGQKPATEKPLTKLAAQNIKAFITKKNSPKVTTLKGRVRIFKIAPRVIFNKPNTKATNKATQKLAITIPGTMEAAANTPKAVNNTFKTNFINIIINYDLLYHFLTLVAQLKCQAVT